VATVVDSGCTIAGRIETDGHLEIHGHIEGSVRARSVRIHAVAQVIADVSASERIDVDAGARIVGDLRAPIVELAAGARIEGRVDLVHPRGAAPVAAPPELSEAKTLRIATRPPLRRPTRPPPPPSKLPPSMPRPAPRARLVTRRLRKPEDGE
jgi:cytoskeletal protein CcmA (bactofilin family)